MPRTKVKRSAVAQKTKNNKEYNSILEQLEKTKQLILDEVNHRMKTALEDMVEKDFEERVNIPKKYLKMQMSDVKKLESFSTNPISKESAMNVQMKNTKKPKTINSMRSFEDEGYLTDSSGPRASRSSLKKTQNTRVTRSLSRTEKTPVNKNILADSYGLILPKVKPKVQPNAPLVLVRRPRIGEMVLSVRGSPILAAPTLESMANINIPLVDGTLLSLQAQAGLRKSQIPDLDPKVKRQLQTLRQHLDVMVSQQ